MNRKEELQKYLKETANPLLERLVVDLLKSQPKKTALVVFCRNWFQKEIKRQQANDQASSEEDEAEEVASLPKSAKPKGKVRRAVSAEVYGEYNKKEDFQPPVIPKSEQVKRRISQRLKESFLFRSLEEKQTDIVISAMQERRFAPGEKVIAQGADGDVLYVVDAGELDCFKTFPEGQKLLKTYKPGEAFGELALLYNAPRAATIISKTSSTLFALDRLTFNNIVKEAAQKKRKHNEAVLAKVEILKEMDGYERSQIADVLKEVNVEANEMVIRQGQTGDKFYIVVMGEFAATKMDSHGQQATVLSYKEGDYFGELALMKDIPRQASVIAKTPGKLVYIERDTFKRVIGPVEKIMQRKAQSYSNYRES